MKNVKFSSLQMAMLLYPTILATAILSVPSLTANYAKQDLWFSPIMASLIGYITLFVSNKLNVIFPDKTVIQFSENIIGKTPGKIISFIFLLFYLQTTGLIVRDYGEFIVSSFLFKTPLVVIMASMVLLCAFVVYGGVEVLGRTGQLLFPIFVAPFLFFVILLSPDFELGNILPIFEEGIIPSIKGAIPLSGWFSEAFIITFLFPYLTDKKKGMKYGMISILGVMITLVIVNLTVLFVLGTTTSSKIYPLMNVSRYISYADFFENLDSVIMAIWILGAFVKISVFYFAIVIGTAQWLNLSDYRPLIWPIGILMIEFSYWSIPNMMSFSYHGNIYFSFYGVPIQTIIPLLLLFVSIIKKRKKGEQRQPNH